MFANMNTRYGQPNPAVIQPGFQDAAQGLGGQTNFQQPSGSWLQAQNAANLGMGQSQNPAYVPHTGYGQPIR
ncbi:MAG: hypothetical protein WKG00_34965 [Polyangiaceae bacterium]